MPIPEQETQIERLVDGGPETDALDSHDKRIQDLKTIRDLFTTAASGLDFSPASKRPVEPQHPNFGTDRPRK